MRRCGWSAWRDGRKLGMGGGELLLDVGRAVKNIDGLVDLDPLCVGCLEVGRQLVVDEEQLGQERGGLEAEVGIICHEREEQDRGDGYRHIMLNLSKKSVSSGNASTNINGS